MPHHDKEKYPGGVTWVDKEYDPNFMVKPPLVKRIIKNKTFRYTATVIFAAIVYFISNIAILHYKKGLEHTSQGDMPEQQNTHEKQESSDPQ